MRNSNAVAQLQALAGNLKHQYAMLRHQGMTQVIAASSGVQVKQFLYLSNAKGILLALAANVRHSEAALRQKVSEASLTPHERRQLSALFLQVCFVWKGQRP